MITSRDQLLLSFLTSVRYATTQQIIDVIFPNVSKSIPYRRLDHLIKCKLINRKYYNLAEHTQGYVYYLDKKPLKKNLRHELKITQFYVELVRLGYTITSFEKTPIYRGFKPDAMVEFEVNGVIKKVFLEVQLSKHDCISKYYNINPNADPDIPGYLWIVTDHEQQEHSIKNLRIIFQEKRLMK